MKQSMAVKSGSLRYSRFAAAMKLMPPAFMERVIGILDAKSNQVRQTEEGYLSPRILRRKTKEEAMRNEIYEKAWRRLAEIHGDIMHLVEEYRMIMDHSDDAENDEICLRHREQTEAKLNQIRERLTLHRESIKTADAAVRHHIAWVGKTNRNKVLSYWKGILSTDKRATFGVEPVSFALPEDASYVAHFAEMNHAISTILSDSSEVCAMACDKGEESVSTPTVMITKQKGSES